MSYLALYRKYRPVTFDDFVGQSEVASIIKNEILNNRISHAYLFSGPRGTGKTSAAKIIARMINCSNLGSDGVPCGKCPSCLAINNNDVVEIDAASNNGVDEIRELRDKVNLVPTVGKYKVYIIDEVHMLTTQAFNALLKTLEEPPSHAIFILATTEFYKIPSTVVSRCQKFQFLKFSNEDIVSRLKDICKKEKIKASDDVLFEIARLSDGGLRDAINMLDQLSSFKSTKIDVSDVYNLNGVVSYDNMAVLLEYILKGDIKNIVLFVDNLNKNGFNFDKFVYDFVDYLKDLLVYYSAPSYFSDGFELESLKKSSLLFDQDVICDFISYFNDVLNQMRNSGFSKIVLVTSLIKLSNKYGNKVLSDSENEISKDEDNNLESLEESVENDINLTSDSVEESNAVSDNSNVLSDEIIDIRVNNAFATASKKNKEDFIDKWDILKDSINSVKYNSLIGIVDDLDIMVVGDRNVIFSVKYDSLIERIYDYLSLFEEMISDFYGKRYSIVFLTNDNWESVKNKYIEDIKEGKKYQYIEEVVEKIDNNVYTNNDVSKLVSLVGNDVITYK